MTDLACADLLDLLADHQPGDVREERSLESIRGLIRTAEDPFSRRSFQPGHLTASAVVVDPSGARALLVFHEKLRLWLQPGGHFEAGERDPAQAAAREVLEETSLSTHWPGDLPPLLDVDVHEIPASTAEPAHERFDLRFLLVAEGEVARAGDGASAVRWIDLRGVGALDLDPGLLRALSKARARAGVDPAPTNPQAL